MGIYLGFVEQTIPIRSTSSPPNSGQTSLRANPWSYTTMGEFIPKIAYSKSSPFPGFQSLTGVRKKAPPIAKLMERLAYSTAS
jgi:hypothetical protein